VAQLEFVVRENEFKLEEKQQAIETSKKVIIDFKHYIYYLFKLFRAKLVIAF